MNHLLLFNILKRYPFLLLLLWVLSACSGNQNGGQEKQLSGDVVTNPASAGKPIHPGALPQMNFSKDEHDFGRLVQGETVTFGFVFTNAGGDDLLISSVSSSCGCTVTDYPRNPMKPGEKGVIDVTFKSEGKKGFQNKTVTVMANTQPNTKVLRVKCEVWVPKDEE